jgi:signal transduction histidine kinase
MNRILLVDDDTGILDLLVRLISPLGYQCVKAAGGEAAVEILSRESFSIMLTDMVMPGLDGMGLLRHARLNFPEMDVLILTGFSAFYSFTDVIKEGAADFLQKPVDKAELKAKLYRVSREQALRRSLLREIEVRTDAEAQLRQHQLRLQELVDQRTLALKKANEKLLDEIEERRNAENEVRNYAEKVKLFAYYVSHDLKTPALSIHGLADLLLRKCSPTADARFTELCRLIAGSARQLIKLVDNINVYIQSKEPPLELEEVAVAGILAAIRGEFAETLAERRVRLEISPALPVVKADPLSLTRVFRNYIDNALKYGGDGLTRVEVAWVDTADQQVFLVSNDGVAIGPEEGERIFGLFNRSRESKGRNGTGLGLAIVREIAERHQGRAWVESDPQGRTCFCFSIRKDLQSTAGSH